MDDDFLTADTKPCIETDEVETCLECYGFGKVLDYDDKIHDCPACKDEP